MNDFKKASSSRRGFLQRMGAIALLPLINVESVFAEVDSSNRNAVLKVLTCNIRVDLPEDEQKGNGWSKRKEGCIQIIKRSKADIIGFQEVLKNQFLDLKKGLSDYYGIGFDGPEMDAHKEGYHGIAKNPIFFSKKRFELLNAGGYWLSENPLEAGSISWESARARNASWVRLLDKKTGKEFRLVNLHLDHVKDEAKLQQIKLVLKESAQYQSDFVQILTGDFNSGPDSAVIKEIMTAGWKDTFSVNNIVGKVEGTTHAFVPHDMERAKRAKKIDFIFTKGPVSFISAKIIKDNWKGVYPSDHYFVDAEITL